MQYERKDIRAKIIRYLLYLYSPFLSFLRFLLSLFLLLLARKIVGYFLPRNCSYSVLFVNIYIVYMSDRVSSSVARIKNFEF